MKAIRLSSNSIDYKPLENLLGKLSNSETEIYKYNNLIYIQASILYKPLNTTPDKFTQSAKSPIHYIKIKNNIFISRYGLFLMVGQSTQPAALKIQDYIYEVLYKLETTGQVKLEDIEKNNLLLDLTIVKSIEKQKTELIEELTEYKNDYLELEKKNKNLIEENEKIIEICKKLTRHLGKNPKATTLIKPIIDKIKIDDYIEDDDSDDLNIGEIKKDINSIKKNNKNLPINNNYYIYQSTNTFVDLENNILYEYKLEPINSDNDEKFMHNNITYNNFKEFSADYLLGGIKTDIEYVIYATVTIDVSKYSILKLLFSNLHLSNTFMTQLLSVI